MLLDAPVEAATRRQALAGAAALLTLTACGGRDAPAEPATRTVTGDYGDVDVPVAPRRVAAATSADADVALVLDLPLVGAPGARGSATRPFPPYQPADRLSSVTRFAIYPELQLEAISAIRPDCILNGGNVVPDYHNRLSRVAPTLSYSEQLFADWRRGLRFVARAFDRGRRADEFVERYDARVAGLRGHAPRDTRVAMIYPAGAGTFTVYARGAQTLRTVVDCGFALADVTPATFDEHREYSLEQIGVLEGADALLLFLDVNVDDSDQNTLQRDRSGYEPITASPLWRRLPAVRAGRVYDVPAELAYASPLTATANADLVERTLLA